MLRTAGELAKYLGASLVGDASARIAGVAGLGDARAEDLIYAASPKHYDLAQLSSARCVIAAPGAGIPGKTVIECEDPKFAFAKAADWLLPRPAREEGIHRTAIVAPSAAIAASASVGPYAVIEDELEIGAGSTIGAFGCLGRAARVGENCTLHPRVTLYAGAQIGNRVEIHSGAVIGADGFGYVFGEGRHWKFPQMGSVQIGDDVEIGANAAIDRGSLDATRIGRDVKIDNLVQIAHNVRIGEHSIVAAQTGISGSTTLEDRVIVGGQVGIADHCKIEAGARLGAQAGVPSGKTIRERDTVWGTPARPLARFKAQYAWYARLPELAARLRALERAVQSETD
ncbi:MAG: UDP-3-O-(3-hydroxymyristoyl)glucosamine N-acyltransferase [Acidobacteriota bacterium]|nr:UDP-3-O-(3-hydroxymyristoyl)glucosamine N-acyltransferase [Acidobacteriota bacterium]